MKSTYEQNVQRAEKQLEAAKKAVTTTQATVDKLLEELKKARDYRVRMKKAVKFAAQKKPGHDVFKYNMLDASRARTAARDAEARYELAVRQRDEAFDVALMRQYVLTNLQREHERTVNETRVSNRVKPLPTTSVFTRIKELWYEVLR